MRILRPDTFLLTMPDGVTKVLCWQREREQIRQDVHATGTVILIRDVNDEEVYRRIAPDSEEAAFIRASRAS